MEGGDKKRLRPRNFSAGDAINTATNYFTQWGDLRELLTDITDKSRWLLITGPWQSGKSSLMFALADEVNNRGYHPVVTTLSSRMIAAANDVSKQESLAADAFFTSLSDRLVANSRQALKRGTSTGVQGLVELFQGEHEKEIIWFIDEASLLNDIKRTSIIQALLSELRMMKQEAVSRHAAGSYYLRSFVLVGTPKLKQLIGDLRIERIREVGDVPSSPGFDPYDPLGNSISPLSMERSRALDTLMVEDIVMLLSEYAMEHEAAEFRLIDADGSDVAPSAGESDAAILKFSKSIWGLTSGHKGMVCTCCEYLTRKSIYTYTQWKRQLRLGHVSKYVFYCKAYGRVVSNVTEYSEPAREVVLHCIETGDSVTIRDLSVVLRPLNDGVLERVGDATVGLTSRLFLAAFLEDCSFASVEALPAIGSFLEVIQATFPYMNYYRLTRGGVLNANGQPSEYIWACEFLLALKFVLENGYKAAKYTIMVEAKRRDKNGRRRTRLDFLLKSAGSPSKGFELQAAGVGSACVVAIKAHVKKAAYYGELHSCQMHYVYLQYGSYGVDAKATIEEESKKFKTVNCWFVQYLPESKKWDIERLFHESGWISVQQDAATNFPKFKFQKRRRV